MRQVLSCLLTRSLVVLMGVTLNQEEVLAAQQPARAFYCKMEALTARGIVINDGTCLAMAANSYADQLKQCRAEFRPRGLSGVISYTVTCTPT